MYEHVPSKRQLLKQHNPDYQLPAALKPHIDLILGLDELPMATKYHSHRIQSALPQVAKPCQNVSDLTAIFNNTHHCFIVGFAVTD